MDETTETSGDAPADDGADEQARGDGDSPMKRAREWLKEGLTKQRAQYEGEIADLRAQLEQRDYERADAKWQSDKRTTERLSQNRRMGEQDRSHKTDEWQRENPRPTPPRQQAAQPQSEIGQLVELMKLDIASRMADKMPKPAIRYEAAIDGVNAEINAQLEALDKSAPNYHAKVQQIVSDRLRGMKLAPVGSRVQTQTKK